jgi:hypothetical protein
MCWQNLASIVAHLNISALIGASDRRGVCVCVCVYVCVCLIDEVL